MRRGEPPEGYAEFYAVTIGRPLAGFDWVVVDVTPEELEDRRASLRLALRSLAIRGPELLEAVYNVLADGVLYQVMRFVSRLQGDSGRALFDRLKPKVQKLVDVPVVWKELILGTRPEPPEGRPLKARPRVHEKLQELGVPRETRDLLLAAVGLR